eukprot:4450257-Pleurochrysis_carterae.AAC.1
MPFTAWLCERSGKGWRVRARARTLVRARFGGGGVMRCAKCDAAHAHRTRACPIHIAAVSLTHPSQPPHAHPSRPPHAH